MSLSDYLKCPGPERSMAAIPEIYPCPGCGNPVEIWSDERKRRCPECNLLVQKKARQVQDEPYPESKQARLQSLIQTAMASGASDAAIISSADIVVDDNLARLCQGDPKCENYGLAPSCPPHVSGPSGFRKHQKQSRYTIVVRIDVPSAALFSDQRRDIMQLLHGIVSSVEQTAKGIGFKNARAFAGGSCKKIFCSDYSDCQRLSPQAQCRHPDSARPSMSGYGINVAKMIQTAGWDLKAANHGNAENPEAMTWVAGIILLMK